MVVWFLTPLEIEDEDEQIGKPWTYELNVVQATGLPVHCFSAYIQYDFFGETFVSECIEELTYSPKLQHKKVHHIPCVTKEFLDWLKQPLEMEIHVTQEVALPPTSTITTSNEIVAESVLTGEPKGYDHADVAKPKSAADVKNEELLVKIQELTEENTMLKSRVAELEGKLGISGPAGKLQEALATDAQLNA